MCLTGAIMEMASATLKGLHTSARRTHYATDTHRTVDRFHLWLKISRLKQRHKPNEGLMNIVTPEEIRLRDEAIAARSAKHLPYDAEALIRAKCEHLMTLASTIPNVLAQGG